MDQNGINVAALIGTPGLSVFGTAAKVPYRGHVLSADGSRLFAVFNNTFYEISSGGTFTSRGTMTSTSGRCSLSASPLQIMISDGASKGYLFTLATNAFAAIGSGAPTSDFNDYIDTYFVANVKGTFGWQISNPSDGATWDASKITSAEGKPDPIVCLKTMAQKVFTFGSVSIEQYYDSGNALFPFDRISGALIVFGVVAPWSTYQIENEFFFLGQNNEGTGVFRCDGNACTRISPPWLDFLIKDYSDTASATAFSYTQETHRFYVLTFPTSLVTWVYDVATGLWHQRQTYGSGRWIADGHVFYQNNHYVFDYASGNVYLMSDSVYTDNGTQIQRIRAGKTIIGEDFERITHDKFDLWLEPGVDNSACAAPKAMLRYSDDGGYTWGNERWQAMQLRGDYAGRCRWARNGQARNRVYEVTITDPVRVAIIAAVINAAD